jgi:NAD(P)-dependent dehydrogenase (short-subunit alcohol dehydrogenase family)
MKKQKVWFITGASRGFGFEIAKAALHAGDKVVATVRKNAEQLVASLGAGSDLLVVVLDVTNKQQVEEGVRKALATFGRVDVLVNNAGYGFLGAFEEATDEDIFKQYNTNVFGLLYVTRALLPHMRQAKAGHIINFSSLFGYKASAPGFGIYASTKFAVEGISEGLAAEVKPLGIHVTSVAPGVFATDFLASDSYIVSDNSIDAYASTVGQLKDFAQQLHGNQPGDPAKFAQVIIALSNSSNPPVHLPIGKDAIAAFREKMVETETEIKAWEEISASTDFQHAAATA